MLTLNKRKYLMFILMLRSYKPQRRIVLLKVSKTNCFGENKSWKSETKT